MTLPDDQPVVEEASQEQDSPHVETRDVATAFQAVQADAKETMATLDKAAAHADMGGTDAEEFQNAKDAFAKATQEAAQSLGVTESGGSAEPSVFSREAYDELVRYLYQYKDALRPVDRSRGDYDRIDALAPVAGAYFREHAYVLGNALHEPGMAGEVITLLYGLRDSMQTPVLQEMDDFIRDNVEVFEEEIRRNFPIESYENLNMQEACYQLILESGSGDQQQRWQWGLDVLYRNMDSIQRLLQPDEHGEYQDAYLGVKILGKMIETEKLLAEEFEEKAYGYDSEAFRTMEDFILGPVDHPADVEHTAKYIEQMYDNAHGGTENGWDVIVSSRLEEYGLDVDKTLNAWAGVGMRGKDVDIVNANLRALEAIKIKLGEEAPQAITLLQKEFNICHFGRYPVELLVKQYKEYEKNDLPYAIGLMGRYDKTGALYVAEQLSNVWTKFIERISDKAYYRIYEWENVDDLIQAVVSADAKYGDTRKISGPIFNIHGQVDGFEIGPGEILQKEAFLDPRVQELRNCFVENPMFVLMSCSTGSEGGIGQTLSEVFQARVVGPEIPTGISELQVEIEDESMIILPVFANESLSEDFSEGVQDNSGRLVYYDKGKRMPPPVLQAA